jgi:hypothetical protein
LKLCFQLNIHHASIVGAINGDKKESGKTKFVDEKAYKVISN